MYGNKKGQIFAVTGLLAALMMASGCPDKQKKPDELPVANNAPAIDENSMGDSDSGKAMGLQTINFPYDSFTMDDGEKSKAISNGKIMKENSGLKVQIEGHCDQRGGIQYNIALGEKRANAIRKFMEGQGISADRLAVISYGKERPLDPGTTEAAFAKNRRANFVITAK
ncbi:MAG: OmpA family protein [Bdellovibrionales bacterium]|nr:OmpA family protein [Bdellovibrionales bacterium]